MFRFVKEGTTSKATQRLLLHEAQPPLLYSYRRQSWAPLRSTSLSVCHGEGFGMESSQFPGL